MQACQRVRRAFRVRGAGEAAPAVFDAGDALCVSSVSCVHFSIPNNRGRTDPVMARTPSAATANGSDKSETIQATADELAHAMAP